MALKRISDLTVATTPLAGTEEVELDVAGSARKCTAQDIADLAGTPAAEDVTYDNAVSGLTATDVQGAIDELEGIVSVITYAPIVTESGTSLSATGANAGNYTRFTNSSAKTYTFDDAETYAVGAEYHGRNAGAGDLTITEAGGMTVNPPAGGTLVVPEGGTFTVKIVAADEADLFGLTVPV